MYKVDDFIYIYLGDLKSSLPFKDLNPNRFGVIIKVEEVSRGMYHYTIDCINNTLMVVNSYDNSFNVCNLEELMDVVYTAGINDKAKDRNINMINKALKEMNI